MDIRGKIRITGSEKLVKMSNSVCDEETSGKVNKNENFDDVQPSVTSEVNTFLVQASIKPLSNASNKIAKIIFSMPKTNPESGTNQTSNNNSEITKDEDGDLILARRKNCIKDLEDQIMFIEYANSTTLHSVGLQIWRGCFLMNDFIIEFSSKFFTGKTVLELGAGTGLSSIVAGIYANKVIATDLPEILDLISSNSKHNEKFIKDCEFQIKALDFFEFDEFDETVDTVIAADVVYSQSINCAFIETLKKILSGSKSKDVFIALEKRFVFTISDLDSVPPLYAHFMDELETVLNISMGSGPTMLRGTSTRVSMEQIPLTFPQYFNYERTKELVLLHILSGQ